MHDYNILSGLIGMNKDKAVQTVESWGNEVVSAVERTQQNFPPEAAFDPGTAEYSTVYLEVDTLGIVRTVYQGETLAIVDGPRFKDSEFAHLIGGPPQDAVDWAKANGLSPYVYTSSEGVDTVADPQRLLIEVDDSRTQVGALCNC